MNLIENTTFNLESTGGVTVTIPINNKVTLLTGDSATGKTKMINFLYLLLADRNKIKSSTVKLDSLIVCKNKEDFYRVVEANPQKKLIIADKFDTVDINKVIEFIIDSENLFVLCAHKDLPKCGYSIDSMMGLSHNTKEYIAYKLFKNAADFMTNTEVRI